MSWQISVTFALETPDTGVGSGGLVGIAKEQDVQDTHSNQVRGLVAAFLRSAIPDGYKSYYQFWNQSVAQACGLGKAHVGSASS
jgi:hypothetical protein